MERSPDLEGTGPTRALPGSRWDVYLRSVTHDLRNSLGPIRTAVFLLKAKGARDPEVETLRLVIERQTAILAGLVDGMLQGAQAAQSLLSQAPEPGEAAQLQAVPEPGAPGPMAAAPRPLRVLLIDDDDHDRLLHQMLLERHGCEVSQAASGEAGLAQAQAQRLDLALVDFEMPGMDGPEVAARLRAAGSPLFLVALTGHSHQEAIARAMAAGFDAFLVKGSDPEGLVRLLQEQRRRVSRPGQ
jgi:CheY-like chemotaxis protein